MQRDEEAATCSSVTVGCVTGCDNFQPFAFRFSINLVFITWHGDKCEPIPDLS